MNNILNLDEIKSVYHDNIKKINMAVKSIAMFIVFFSVLKSDYSNSAFHFLDSLFLVLLLSLILTFISTMFDIRVFMVLFCIFVPISVSSNMIYSIISLLVLMCIFIFYGSVSRKYANLIMFTICCCYLRVPYLVPVYIGLNKKANSLVPILFGLFMYYLTMAMNSGMLYGNADFATLEDIVFGCLYIFDFMFFNSIFLAMFIAFIVTYFLSYILRNNGVDNNEKISIVSSSIIFLIFIIFNVFLYDLNNNIILIVFNILLSTVLTFILCYIECVYDYKKSSKVYFQDDENIYYVKTVPKV